MADKMVDILVRLSAEAQTEEVAQMNSALAGTNNLTKEAEAKMARLNAATKVAFDSKEVKLLNNDIAATNNLISRANTLLAQQKNASFALTQVLREAPAFTYSIQTGLLGISNNIPILTDNIKKLRDAGASNITVFKTLAGSLLSFNSLLSLGIAAVTIFGDRIFASSKETSKAETALKKYNDTLKSVEESSRAAASQEIARINVLTSIAKDVTQSTRNRGLAIKELQKEYPAYFGNLDKEIFLQGKATDAINEATEALLARAAATAAEKKFAAASEKVYDLTLAQADALEKVTKAQAIYNQSLQGPSKVIGPFGSNYADIAKQNLEVVKTEASEITKELDQAGKEQRRLLTDAQEMAKVAGETIFKSSTTKERKAPKEKREKELRASLGLPDKLEMESMAQDVTRLENMAKILDDIYKPDSGSVRAGASPIQPLSDADAERLNRTLQDQVISSETRLEALRKKLRLARHERELTEEARLTIEIVEAQVDYYTEQISLVNQTVQTIGNAANQVIDIEVEKNRRLIEAQEERVARALEIAEKGGAEMLEAEQERLQKLEENQRKYLSTQRSINAVLVASQSAVNVANAVGAVVKAADKGAESGGPIGLVIAIVAAVAALAAGISATVSAVSSIDTGGSTAGYYKGGYTGEGDPRKEAGVVHKKEFVFDHKATGDIGVDNLERLRYGQLVLVDPKSNSVVYGNVDYDGMAKDQNYIRESYYNQLADNSRVEKKLDELNDIMRTKEANITLDSHGFSANLAGYLVKMSKKQKLRQ